LKNSLKIFVISCLEVFLRFVNNALKACVMKHILVVGGTGMLRIAREYFMESGYTVTLLARNRNKLNTIKATYPGASDRIFIISQDYREADKAFNQVKKSVHLNDKIDLALLWIHKSETSFN